MKPNILDLSWISESRTVLMGWAIINVMVLHSCAWAHISLDTYPLRFAYLLCSFLFTGTFMLLSGYGLYFSLTNKNDIKEFYKRRVTRLFLPFLLMATPFYTYSLLSGKISYAEFILHETTLYNVVESNNGMWYISASLIMYLFAPYIKIALGKTLCRSFFIGLIITTNFVILSLAVHYYLPNYSLRTSILWDKLAIFVIGMHWGYLTLKGNMGGGKILIFSLLLFLMLTILRQYNAWLESYYAQSKEMLAVLLVCSVLHYTRKWKAVRLFEKILSWFGTYSLELYVLHMLLIEFVKSILYVDIGVQSNVDNDRIIVLIVLTTVLCICVPVHNITTSFSKKICK